MIPYHTCDESREEGSALVLGHRLVDQVEANTFKEDGDDPVEHGESPLVMIKKATKPDDQVELLIDDVLLGQVRYT